MSYIWPMRNEEMCAGLLGNPSFLLKKKPEEENLLFPLYMSYDYRLLWVELYSPQIHTRTLTLSTSKHDRFWGFSA